MHSYAYRAINDAAVEEPVPSGDSIGPMAGEDLAEPHDKPPTDTDAERSATTASATSIADDSLSERKVTHGDIR